MFTREQEDLLAAIKDSSQNSSMWPYWPEAKLGDLLDIYAGHYPTIHPRNEALTLTYSKKLVTFCKENHRKFPSIKEDNNILRAYKTEIDIYNKKVIRARPEPVKIDIYNNKERRARDAEPRPNPFEITFFQKEAAKSEENETLIEVPYQITRRDCALLVEGITSDRYPEVRLAIQLAKINGCSYFDPISSYDEIHISEALIQANKRQQKLIILAIFFLFKKEFSSQEIIEKIIKPPFDYLLKQNKIEHIPLWIRNLNPFTIDYFVKSIFSEFFQGSEDKFIIYCKLIYEKLVQLSNALSFKKLVSFIEENPEIKNIYGLIGAGHLSMLPESHINTKTKDSNFAQIIVQDRQINIYFFAGGHGETIHYKKMADFLEKEQGFIIPSSTSVPRESNTISPDTKTKMKSSSKGLSYLKKYPATQLVRILVDGNLYKTNPNGVSAYEKREPGCIKAFFGALEKLVSHIDDDEDITIDFIKSLHELCSQGVKQISSHCVPGQFKKVTNHFCLIKENVTKEGIKELLQWIYDNDFRATLAECHVIIEIPSPSHYWGHSYQENNRDKLRATLEDANALDEAAQNLLDVYNKKTWDGVQIPLLYCCPAPEFVEIKLKSILDIYNQEIKKNLSRDEKIRLIAKTIEECERLHPFFDFNGRVFVNLLLNFMLMKNGFPPATFDEPNIFDAYGLTNVVEKINEAIKRTKQIIKKNDVAEVNCPEAIQSTINLFVEKIQQYEEKIIEEKIPQYEEKIPELATHQINPEILVLQTALINACHQYKYNYQIFSNEHEGVANRVLQLFDALNKILRNRETLTENIITNFKLCLNTTMLILAKFLEYKDSKKFLNLINNINYDKNEVYPISSKFYKTLKNFYIKTNSNLDEVDKIANLLLLNTDTQVEINTHTLSSPKKMK